MLRAWEKGEQVQTGGEKSRNKCSEVEIKLGVCTEGLEKLRKSPKNGEKVKTSALGWRTSLGACRGLGKMRTSPKNNNSKEKNRN